MNSRNRRADFSIPVEMAPIQDRAEAHRVLNRGQDQDRAEAHRQGQANRLLSRSHPLKLRREKTTATTITQHPQPGSETAE